MVERHNHNKIRCRIRHSGLVAILIGLGVAQIAGLVALQAGAINTEAALQRVLDPPLGLPPVPHPAENQPTREKIALGRKLFFDSRLSRDGKMSCGTCHVPEQGFTQNVRSTPVGHLGQTVRRNAPTLLNVAYFDRLFHDGRETSLETQFLLPLTAANEMASQSIGFTIEKIGWLADYDGLFEAVFGGGPTTDRIGAALATYQRTLVSAGSRFDKWRYGGVTNALTEREIEGFKLFTGRAKCASCHHVGDSSAIFTDEAFHDIGYGWKRHHERQKGENIPKDFGRFEVTGDPRDRWRYRTPSLRNITLTAPYMHDGRLKTLEDIIRHYNKGGAPHDGQDIRIQKLDLSEKEMAAIAAFLRSLTGDNIDQLIEEARPARGAADKN